MAEAPTPSEQAATWLPAMIRYAGAHERRSPGASSARPSTSVGANSSIQAKKFPTSQPGVQTTLAPAASDDSTVATRPWPWNSGRMFRHRSFSVRLRDRMLLRAELQTLACVCGTIFAHDVVPDVRRLSITSPGRAGSSSDASAVPSSNVNRPASRSSILDSSMTRTPWASATARAGRSAPAATISARGCSSAK